MRPLRAESVHDGLTVALVVAAMGIAAFMPRGESARVRTDGALAIPAGPCKGVKAEHRTACLAAARAVLDH